VRIALAQLVAGADKEANLRATLRRVEEAAAAGAALVVFPECSMAAPPPDQPLAPLAEPLDGPYAGALADAARRHGIAVVAGLYERAADPSRVHNTVVAFDVTGAPLGAYRKVHLYDAFGHRESDRIVPGDGRTLRFRLDGLQVGVLTCYDVRFPELARHLAAGGAELLLLPAAWLRGPLKEEHWETLVRARAIENTVYVAAVGLAGPPFTGRSLLADPMGVAVAAAGEAAALVLGEVEPDRLREVRAANPSLENRRPELYARWAAAAAEAAAGAVSSTRD
jgi:predicted amidohydrolase